MFQIDRLRSHSVDAVCAVLIGRKADCRTASAATDWLRRAAAILAEVRGGRVAMHEDILMVHEPLVVSTHERSSRRYKPGDLRIAYNAYRKEVLRVGLAAAVIWWPGREKLQDNGDIATRVTQVQAQLAQRPMPTGCVMSQLFSMGAPTIFGRVHQVVEMIEDIERLYMIAADECKESRLRMCLTGSEADPVSDHTYKEAKDHLMHAEEAMIMRLFC